MLFLYNFVFYYKNAHNRDYLRGMYFLIILFALLGFYNSIFFNEEMIICISLILYFCGLLIILRKLILVYFFFGSELLYLLFFLLVLLNIIYVKIIIKSLNIRYSNIIYYSKLRFYILLSVLVKNYYLLLSYYKSVFLIFINLLNLKNKISYLDILDDIDLIDSNKINYDSILIKFLLYFNNFSLYTLITKNNIYNYVS